MVEIKETLNVTADAFFSQLAKSAVYDIINSTGKELTPAQLYKGYQYRKPMKNKLGRQGDVDVKITDFQSPICYGAEFRTPTGTTRIHYAIQPVEEQRIHVTYTENFDGDSKSQNLNYKIVSAFYKRSARKKTRKMLHAIEAYILNNPDQRL